MTAFSPVLTSPVAPVSTSADTTAPTPGTQAFRDACIGAAASPPGLAHSRPACAVNGNGSIGRLRVFDVRREAESEGHAEKYRAVIEGLHPEDELVGRGWGKVEPAVGRR